MAQATAGNCSIVELQGTVGSSAALDRQTGFNEIIALFPNMQIIQSQSGDFTRTGGKEVMEGFLRTVDAAEICAVWAHNDDMLIGAIQAMKGWKYSPKIEDGRAVESKGHKIRLTFKLET